MARARLSRARSLHLQSHSSFAHAAAGASSTADSEVDLISGAANGEIHLYRRLTPLFLFLY
jgi:hypothetical protein